MSYDIRIAVKVAGAEDVFADIAEPERSSPTYNLRDMFVACMNWDYEQGIYYKVSEIYPKIERGIYELTYNEKAYKKYNPPNPDHTELGLPSDPTSSSTPHSSQMPILSRHRTPHFC